MTIDWATKRDLLTAGPNETVAAVVQRMSDAECGAVLVTEGERLLGIFTERDLMKRVVAAGKDPTRTPVGEVTTRNPVTVSATVDLTTCYETVKAGGFRHLPVVDEDGKPIGILSSRDFLDSMVVQMSRHVEMPVLFKSIGELRIDLYER